VLKKQSATDLYLVQMRRQNADPKYKQNFLPN
jgi:hypothetical protein